jgi:pyruvate,water dikinase
MHMQWVLFPNNAAQASEMGGKARSLAALNKAGLRIPDWFVVRGEACLQSLSPEARDQLRTGTIDLLVLQKQLASLVPDATVAVEVQAALAKLCSASGRVAVRSSATDEDGSEHSFAGQLESYLFVTPEKVLQKVAAVWRSGFSDAILSYRRHHGLSLLPQPPAVLVQRMVHAEAAGVGFSADPVSGRRGIAVVSAVFGLGTALVSGEADADTWFVARDGKIVETRLAKKQLAHSYDPNSADGVRSEPVPAERAARPALTEDQVCAVAELARRCASEFGRPQDIEWGLEGGRLFLLQSRPITSLAGTPDPDGILNIWDNSNIAESYGGITTPLTYTFARRAYEEVYRQFCRLMKVPQSRIAQNAHVFPCMIGLIRGRVYYNLLNWYRVLAMLPGFTVNRRFMEQMMGVKEALPDELVASLQSASAGDKLKDALHLAGTTGGLVLNHFSLQKRIGTFYSRLNHALRPPNPPLELAQADELASWYLELERQLLTQWDAPLVNDFFAMIFYGVLRKLAVKWCGDSEGTLQNNLLCGEGGLISAEPVRRVRELAELAAKHVDLAAKCAEGEELKQADLDQAPEFAKAYQSYLEKFGDRCLDELKLESPTLHDDPTLLLRSIGQLAMCMNEEKARAAPLAQEMEDKTGQQVGRVTPSAPQSGLDERRARSEAPYPRAASTDQRLRREAEARASEALRGHWFRRLIFEWVLKHTRARVKARENLRFERTRLFGRVRRIFVALGRELHARNLLDAPKDIFYLDLAEILGFCDGTASTVDLKGLVALRRSEFARYATMDPPADRFETRGPVYYGNTFQTVDVPKAKAGPADEWKGIGCCPGVVRGRVRVIKDPREATLKPGEILVAERTDPGWIMLFASAAGLLVERGSLLSHSAIVSREMCLPSVVSIPAITKQLTDGDEVEMNGSTGVVKRMRHD